MSADGARRHEVTFDGCVVEAEARTPAARVLSLQNSLFDVVIHYVEAEDVNSTALRCLVSPTSAVASSIPDREPMERLTTRVEKSWTSVAPPHRVAFAVFSPRNGVELVGKINGVGECGKLFDPLSDLLR
jgi:hypothetical protein